jgi:trehalose-6-phosphate synthase
MMRRQVVENDIYKWANVFLDDLESSTPTAASSEAAG